MARSIEFDYATALDRATWLFWRNGYGDTSLRDLLKVMEIGEGSFYNTLKSKKNLYMACLNHYSETEGLKRGHALKSAPTASSGVRALFSAVLDCLDNPNTPSRLCMLAAMMSEDVLADAELREFAERGIATFSQQLARKIKSDKDAGKLKLEVDPKAVASVIVTYLQGLWRMALISYDRPRFERQISVFLSGFGL